MLAVARTLPPPSGSPISWIQGSAVAMDFPSASFDVVLCQHGLQFFPDRLRALREMHRVLAPSGRALLSVWSITGPYNVAVIDALRQHVGTEAAAAFSASRAVPDAAELYRLVVEAGFRDVSIHPSAMTTRLPALERFVLSHLAATPVASALAAIGAEPRAALAAQVSLALQAYVDGDGAAIPDETNVVRAHA
jgi:SAM-dependent methyltransferase